MYRLCNNKEVTVIVTAYHFRDTTRHTTYMCVWWGYIKHTVHSLKYVNIIVEQMSSGVSRLKGLAVNLGDEISAQNDQLERIAPKVERADTKIRDQNRQMRHILGK